MTALTLAQRDVRLDALRDAAHVNGIDYLEVVTSDQRALVVTFVHPLPGELGGVPAAPPLDAGNVRIEGGVRVRNVEITNVTANGRELRVEVAEPGDFSIYTLRLVRSALDDDAPPAGFDPLLARIDFSFKVGCPNDLDCLGRAGGAPEAFPEPRLDYLAKDYASFRRQMLERLSMLRPGSLETHPADQNTMLVELLAYAGDKLSYYQDAVATEAYLGTARRRVSLRRHARLVDYRVHEGTNARVFVHLDVTSGGALDNATLPVRTALATGDADAPVTIAPNAVGAAGGDVVWFETLHDKRLHAAHNEIGVHTWSDAVACLHAGATSAHLVDTGLALAAGDVLIFEEVRGASAADPDADRSRRWAVRLAAVTPTSDPLTGQALVAVEWQGADALPFDFCLVSPDSSVAGPITVARGNVVLADEGLRIEGDAADPGLEPASPDPDAAYYRPRLTRPGVVHAVPYEHRTGGTVPASRVLEQEAALALAQVSLHDGTGTWSVQRDLLASDRFARDFAVEVENDGTATLRFGDGRLGQRPGSGPFTATYRVGAGLEGNVGPESIRRIAVTGGGVIAVRNPMVAAGATAPETNEEVRRYAPQAFRQQHRAVTEADWTAVAEAYPEVQKARARFRWTRSWYTVFVTVDREGGLPVLEDADFFEGLIAYLDGFRIGGYDLEIRPPRFVPLNILLRVCLEPGYYAADVEAQLMERFSAVRLHDGTTGFFHPDEFSFGEPLYVSRLYATAMEVAGVASCEALRFQRYGKTPAGEITAGVLRPSEAEILRCDTDPSLPENGAIEFEVIAVPGRNTGSRA